MSPEVEKTQKILKNFKNNKNLSKNLPKWGLGAEKGALKVATGISSILLLGAKMEPKMVQKRDKKTRGKREGKKRPSAPFRSILGSLLGAFSAQKSVRERPRSDF